MTCYWKKFEKDLLENLPADESDFVDRLEEEGVIDEGVKKKMNVLNRSKITHAVAIVEEIENSIPDSLEKLRNLLSVMKKYNRDDLKTLAQKIENHLDPVGTPFVCETMAYYFGSLKSLFSNFPYKNLSSTL